MKEAFFLFFFNDTATTEIYTLSLHDALPICSSSCPGSNAAAGKRLSTRQICSTGSPASSPDALHAARKSTSSCLLALPRPYTCACSRAARMVMMPHVRTARRRRHADRELRRQRGVHAPTPLCARERGGSPRRTRSPRRRHDPRRRVAAFMERRHGERGC